MNDAGRKLLLASVALTAFAVVGGAAAHQGAAHETVERLGGDPLHASRPFTNAAKRRMPSSICSGVT